MNNRKPHIGRSSTGTYHSVLGDSTNCNGRSFRGSTTPSLEYIRAASENMFCKKCFGPTLRADRERMIKFYCEEA